MGNWAAPKRKDHAAGESRPVIEWRELPPVTQ
jgi:hypothetical protein